MWNKSFLMLYLSSVCHGKPLSTESEQWDVVMLVQHWLPTNCKHNQHKEPTIVCRMPEHPDSWTVHGIWPSSSDSFSPEYCNLSWLLDPEEIVPLQQQLDEHWPDTLRKPESFWSYEWLKHGTCATVLPTLNTPIKYFQKGINLRKKYNITTILESAGITPGDEQTTYTLKDFESALYTFLGKEARLKCFIYEGKQYISEVQICFTKALEVTDCNFNKSRNYYERKSLDGAKHGSCDPDIDVIYAKYIYLFTTNCHRHINRH